MSIVGSFELWPYGVKAGTVPLVRFSISSNEDGAYHAYRVTDNVGGVVIYGTVAKSKSGHRNILHLLRAILSDPALDQLGVNYITTPYDKTAP